MKEEEKLLYQDLPSIKPRVSREERLASRRNKPCSDCNPSFERAKKSAKHLRFFYMAILGIGIIATQIYQKRVNTVPTITTKNTVINVSFSQKISVTLVEQPHRYGLSVLFRNNGGRTWEVGTIEITSVGVPLQKVEINQKISSKDFYSLFIPLAQEIDDIKDINITL